MDYDPRTDLTHTSFTTAQNKLYYAVRYQDYLWPCGSEKTLVDITNLKDNCIAKNDVKIAKNYRIKIEL